MAKKGFRLGKRPRPPQQKSFVVGWKLKKFTQTVYVWVSSIMIKHFSVKIGLLYIFHAGDQSCQSDPASLFLGQIKLLYEEAHLSEQDSGSVHHNGAWPTALFAICCNWDLQAAQWSEILGIYIFSGSQGRRNGSKVTIWNMEMRPLQLNLFNLWLLSISFSPFCSFVEIFLSWNGRMWPLQLEEIILRYSTKKEC